MKTKIIYNYLKKVHTEYFIAVLLIFYENKAIQLNISIKDAEVKYEFSTNFTDSHPDSSLRDMQKRIKNPCFNLTITCVLTQGRALHTVVSAYYSVTLKMNL